jgi:hypothetical protein
VVQSQLVCTTKDTFNISYHLNEPQRTQKSLGNYQKGT